MAGLGGTWLVGIQGFLDDQDYAVLGVHAGGDPEVSWAVIRAESGRFVVYRQIYQGSATIQIFDSFEAMAKVVPAGIAEDAGRTCGLIPSERIPGGTALDV